MPPSKEFVTVGTFATVVEAEALRGILEGEGIRALVTDANLLSVHPLLGSAVGGVGLQVHAADAERALAVVRAHQGAEEGDAVPGEAADRSDTACLACGAEFPEYLERCPACGLSYS